MKPKFISVQSGELLAYFNERNESCFGYAKAFKALPHTKKGAVRELLGDMTRRGLLMRLKDGLFYIIPYEQDAESFIPDWHLIAECLVSDAEHYVGY